MKLREMLNPEFQHRYDKALRDWEAGRNLEEAAAIVFGGKNKQATARLVEFQRKQIAERKNKGKKLLVAGLGTLTHEGEQFVCKKKTLLYPKASVNVELDPALVTNDAVGKIWERFCRRERSLVRELESAIAKYYREIRKRPSLTGEELLPLKRNSDIWATLGKPKISFRLHRRKVELQLAWSPKWEEEHGLYVYLSSDAKIRHLGEFR